MNVAANGVNNSTLTTFQAKLSDKMGSTLCPLADKLIGSKVSEADRKALLGHLGKIPKPALEKLVKDGWTVSAETLKPNSDGTKDGGYCKVSDKTVVVDSEILKGERGGRVVLHEMAHALDYKGTTAPKGMLGRMLAKAGANGGRQVQFGSNQDAKMAELYRGFQAQNLAEFGAKVLQQAPSERSDAPLSLNFKTPFHGQGQVLAHGGSVIVQTDNQSANCQQKRMIFDVKKFEQATDSRHEVNGATIGLRDTGDSKTVVMTEADNGKLKTTWTDNADYVSSSNLPSELYAEAVAAYLDNPDSRQNLAQEAPQLHAFVQESLNEYIIAG